MCFSAPGLLSNGKSFLNHSDRYGLKRISRNVKPDAVQNRIGQTVNQKIAKKSCKILNLKDNIHYSVRLGEI